VLIKPVAPGMLLATVRRYVSGSVFETAST
jgi:hypothetical protein